MSTSSTPGPTPGAAPALGSLPDAVRARVVALAAEALPGVASLPAALKRLADFAPQRRARLGASALVAALEDEGLRERVGTQVAARRSYDLGGLVAAPEAEAAADPVEVAALVWLVRPEGAEAVLTAALDRLRDRVEDQRGSEELERLRARLTDAEHATREARARSRERIEEYKTENASLRRKLGESRAGERAARAALEEAESAVERERAESQARTAGQDREVRRLKERVAELEEQVAAQRRAERRAVKEERDEATVRARMLLDTVIDAAAGLRRELALPSVEGAPADRVEAALVEAYAAAPGTAAAPPSPAQLERLLGLPRARLLVDGYNVSKTAWPEASLEAQRNRLLAGLAPLVARLGAETTVVFDAAASASRTVVAAPRGIKLVFSPEGVIADDVIRDLVAAEPPGRVVVVVSSDRQVATDVARAGARALPASTLAALLG